jgi:uncharacterized coiled-coil protein SlyX
MDIQLESSNLRCDECGTIRNIYDGSNELYICSDCDKELNKKEEQKEDKKKNKKEEKESEQKLKLKLCSVCKVQHQRNEKHSINHNYNIKFEYCIKHQKPLENYCNKCNKNFCEEEEKSHAKHDYFPLKRKRQKENYIDELKKKINELNDNIKKYIKELDILKELFDSLIINYKKNLDNHLKLNDYIYNASENLNNYNKINLNLIRQTITEARNKIYDKQNKYENTIKMDKKEQIELLSKIDNQNKNINGLNNDIINLKEELNKKKIEFEELNNKFNSLIF